MNLLILKVPYCNPFQNAMAINKGEYKPILPLKLVAIATSLDQNKNEG